MEKAKKQDDFADRMMALSKGRGARKKRVGNAEFRCNAKGVAGRAKGRGW